MATILTHAVAGAAVAAAAPAPPGGRARLVGLGFLAGALADLDSIGFAYGVAYGDDWGHRGLTHSLPVAVALGAALALLGFRRAGAGPLLTAGLTLVLAAATHGVLDAMTDGGLGVAFWAPFDTTRHFLPWTPLEVAPIGIAHFRGEWARRVLVSEAVWAWIPCAALVAASAVVRRAWRPRGTADGA
jgi:inner membrane protein